MKKTAEWLQDALFLDFYLDKRWTFRFKIMNFISGDTLRPILCEIYNDINLVNENEVVLKSRLPFRHARLWTNKLMTYYQKGE